MPNRTPRREDDPPDIDMRPVREESKDVWAKAEAFVDHYKIAWGFWVIFLAIASWIGVHILDPLKAVPDLQAQNVAIITRLDHADEDRKDIANILKIVVRIQCFSLTQSDRAKYGIDCNSIPLPAAGGN